MAGVRILPPAPLLFQRRRVRLGVDSRELGKGPVGSGLNTKLRKNVLGVKTFRLVPGRRVLLFPRTQQ